jgi:hypothetical protein
MHLVKLCTSAMNRAHGVLIQFGVKLAFSRLRQSDREELLIERGVPEVWRRSIAEAVAVVRALDDRLVPLEQELRPIARSDPRVQLLVMIPGIGDLLGLTIASEIGDISRFPTARKLVGCSGLTPRVYQSGENSRTGKLSKSGSTMLRWAAIEARAAGLAPQQSVAPAVSRRQGALRRQGQPGEGRRRPQGPDRQLACPRAAAASQPFAPPGRCSFCPGELQLRSGRLTAYRLTLNPIGSPSSSTTITTSSAGRLKYSARSGRMHLHQPDGRAPNSAVARPPST